MGDVYTSRELDLIEKYGSELKADVRESGAVMGATTSSFEIFDPAAFPKNRSDYA